MRQHPFAKVKTILAGVRAEFPAQELMLRLESLSLAMWYSVEKNFGPTSACDSARKERVAQLEQKFRKLASCLHLPPEEAWLQFTHIKDLVLHECACVCMCRRRTHIQISAWNL